MYLLPDSKDRSRLGRSFALPVRLVKLEIGIWRSLALLVARRVSGQGPGVQAFGYGKEIVPIMAAFVFVSVVELPVVHLLVPWAAVRLVAIALSVWGLLWMLGLLASMKVFPHLLDDRGLRIRYGAPTDILVPWESVASVEARKRRLPDNKHVHVVAEDGDTVLSVAVLKQTRVDVALARPTVVELADGTAEITECRFYADDVRAFVEAVRERTAAALSRPAGAPPPTG